MKKHNLKYIIGVFILLLSFGLNAQTTEMVANENTIDEDFVVSYEIRKKIISHSKKENEINLISEKSNDSLFSIYVFNKTADTLTILTQDSHLFLIQEAKDKNGEWKPVEHWNYSTCGNSYLTKKIEPNGILKTESVAYNGKFETQVRFKLLNNDGIFYSNPIIGFVNLSQFSIPKGITENRFFERVETAGGNVLLKKILFLEPNGIQEFEKKWESYLVKMAELRKKNKN